jgi:hypothetical protein
MFLDIDPDQETLVTVTGGRSAAWTFVAHSAALTEINDAA